MLEKIDQCQYKGFRLDTLSVDQLLGRIEWIGVQVLYCMSPMDSVDLPYFGRYIRRQRIRQDVNFFVIPLCDGHHFQAYIIDISAKTVIQVDSLRECLVQKSTAQKIANLVFEEKQNDIQTTFRALFPTRVQFDSHSCGAWMVSGVAAHILKLDIPESKEDAFQMLRKLTLPTSTSHASIQASGVKAAPAISNRIPKKSSLTFPLPPKDSAVFATVDGSKDDLPLPPYPEVYAQTVLPISLS